MEWLRFAECVAQYCKICTILQHTATHCNTLQHTICSLLANIGLFCRMYILLYRVFLQKSPMFLGSLLIVATSWAVTVSTHCTSLPMCAKYSNDQDMRNWRESKGKRAIVPQVCARSSCMCSLNRSLKSWDVMCVCV